MNFSILVDGLNELVDGAKAATVDTFGSNFPKPPFDLVDPRESCRGEVDMVKRSLLKPPSNFGCLVCGVIVHDKLNLVIWQI